MAVTRAIGIAIRGLFGRLVGLVLAIPVFFVSLIRGKRAVHGDGLLCTADVTAVDDIVGPRLAGPALVRLSGAFANEGATKKDILGCEIRLRRPTDEPPASNGDQDVILGTFESFASAGKDKAQTREDDYLANDYDTVTPWRVRGVGVVRLRIAAAAPRDPARGPTRRDRLERDIADGAASITLAVRRGHAASTAAVATIRLTGISALDHRQLRASLRRTGRGLTAVGFRNGIRRVVYPVSQAARRIRGG